MATSKSITTNLFFSLLIMAALSGCKTMQQASVTTPVISNVMPGDSLYKATMLPVLEGRIGKKFFHTWALEGGEHGTATASAPLVYRIPVEIPIGKWIINVNTTVSHKNGQLRMWIETDQGISESAFMNGYNTNDIWQTFTFSHFFCGVETKTTVRANMVLVLTVGKSSTSAELGSISHVITGFQLKKATKLYH